MTHFDDPTVAFLAFRDHGDPTGIARVFDATSTELRRIAVHLVGDPATAEDLVQSTYLAAIEAASAFHPEARVVPWLVGILRKQALMVQRRQRRRLDPRRVLEGRAEDPDPAHRAEDREFEALVTQALAELPEAYRPVLDLHLKHGLTAAEIASALGRPGGTVRTQIVRGLEKLRDLLPVGTAGLIAGLLPSTGMAAVRRAVLEAGAARAGSGAVGATGVITGTVVGGSLVMKKLVWSAAALLLVALSAWSLGVFSTAAPPSTAAGNQPRLVGAGPDPAPPRSAAPTAEESRVAAAVPAAPTTPEPAAVKLRGIVRDAEGSPVAGARVFAGRTRRAGDAWKITEGPAADTDAAGRFELLVHGSRFQLTATHGTQMSERIVEGRVQNRTVVEGLELDLAPTGIAEGVLLDHLGQPIPHHPVHASFSYGYGSHSQTKVPGVVAATAIGHELITDAEGRFRARVIAGRRYTWEVQHPQHPMLRESHGTEDSPFSLRLPRGGEVRGRVSRADGRPAAGALVVLNGQPRRTVRCGADGRFEFRGVGISARPRPDAAQAIGARWVYEIENPYLKIDDPASAIHIEPLAEAQREGELERLEIRLGRPEQLAGRVRWADGSPIAGAKIRLVGDRQFEPGYSHGEASTWEWAHDHHLHATDGEGRFAISRLYRGQFQIQVTPPGSADIPHVHRVAASALGIDIRIDPAETRGVIFVGQARDALTKEPIPEFRLVPWYRGRSIASHVPCVTDGGRFRTEALQPGHIRISVSAEGYASQRLAPRFYGGGTHELILELTPSRAIDIRVESGGQAVQAFKVRARNAAGAAIRFDFGSTQMSEVVARRGEAQLRGLPAERVTLLVEVPGHPVHEEVLDLREPRSEPLVVHCGAPKQAVAAEILVLCADRAADVAGLEKLFAQGSRKSMRELLTQAMRRQDVRLPEVSVLLELGGANPGVRPSKARLSYRGKTTVGPGLEVPVYDKTLNRYDGNSYRTERDELPFVTVEHLQQDLVLKVTAKGYAAWEKRWAAGAFRPRTRAQASAESLVARALVILRPR